MQTGSANLNHKKLLLVIAILIPIAYFLRLGSYQLIFEEPRRALVALEMLIADNWIVPTTNGALYYNKPPFYNWVLIGVMNLLGKSEWVIRLPSILSVMATALLHYRISRIYVGKKVALLSALFYVTSADILFYFSLLGEIDLFYALIVYLQCVLIFHFYQQKKWHWLFICTYLLTTAGVLTKGIPSFFFQAITLLLIFILNKDFKRLFSIWHLAGIILLFLTTGGYFYLYSLQHNVEPFLARLFTETFSRTTLQKSIGEQFNFLLTFPVLLIKISAPWFLLFLLTFKTNWKVRLKNSPFLRFCLWFCISNGVLYLLSPGTRERYLYMFFPFVYILLAHAVCSLNDNLWLKRFYIFIGITVSAGLIGLTIFGYTLNFILPALICLSLSFMIATWLFYVRFTDSYSHLLASVIFILVARVGFDLVVLPTKKRDDPYKIDAQRMSEITRNEEVYLFGPAEPKIDEVKFAGQQFITFKRNEPTILAFQTSYYLSRYTGKILKFTTNEKLKGFYISPEKEIDAAEVKVFYRFYNRINKEKYWYILYKNMNQ